MSLVYKLSFDEAADLIDVYGPDETFWPSAEKPALRRLMANDTAFRDYVEDAKWLESMLDNWSSSEDGATIDWNDDDFMPNAAGPTDSVDDQDDDTDSVDDQDDRNDDEDHDDGPIGSIPTGDGQNDAEVEEDMPGSGAGSAAPIPTPSDGEDEDDDAPEIIELDPADIKDMDGMFQDFIRKQMEDADPTEFRVFTRDFDEMVDIKIPDHVSLEGIDQRVAQTTGPLQKDLRRMIASRSQVKRIPGMRRGRLHAPNLHRIMAGDDRVFTRRQEADSLDTAISLLIDCSGSMNGTRTVLAAETAYAIGSVLAKLGIAFECLGFTDNHYDPRIATKEYQQQLSVADATAKIIRAIPIVMPKFKTFDERWTMPVQRRFAHVHNSHGYSDHCGYKMGSTPEGCGLEFAARRLLARKEKRKILISMTDGEPGGHVYNARGHSDFFAYQQQSINVVKSIEASGIDLVGVGIQHAGPQGYYANSMVINKVEEMPKQLLALLKRFIVG